MNDIALFYINLYGSEEAAIEALEREAIVVQQLINDLPHVFTEPVQSFFRSRDSHIRRIIGENKIEDVDWIKEGF